MKRRGVLCSGWDASIIRLHTLLGDVKSGCIISGGAGEALEWEERHSCASAMEREGQAVVLELEKR